MKKLILFLFIFLFLLFGLFLANEIVYAAYVEVTWNEPLDYFVTGHIYQRGDNIIFSGSFNAPVCANPMTEARLKFYVETQNGTKNWTKIGEKYWDWRGSPLRNFTYNETFTLPSNTYIGLNVVKVEYWFSVWYQAVVEEYTIEGKQIRVLSPPTAPGITISPTTPYPSDSLTCIITTASTSVDPLETGITYTYKWYKNGALQSGLTKSNTTAATYTISYTNTSAGEQWKCEVTPKNSARLTGSPGSYTVTISSMSFQPKIFSNIIENLKKGFSEAIRIFERFAEENKKLFSLLH